MIYDIESKKWTKGPSLNIFRRLHACMVDLNTETIYVMGGWNGNVPLDSTEALEKGSKKWKMGSNLKQGVFNAAAVSSRSVEYVGYMVGGGPNDALTSKSWGLRRRDMEWIEMSTQLEIPRKGHSVVNIQLGEIGC